MKLYRNYSRRAGIPGAMRRGHPEDGGVGLRLARIRRSKALFTCSLMVPAVLQSGVYRYSRSGRGFPRGEHAPQVWVSHVASKYVVARSVAKCLSDLRTVPVA